MLWSDRPEAQLNDHKESGEIYCIYLHQYATKLLNISIL